MWMIVCLKDEEDEDDIWASWLKLVQVKWYASPNFVEGKFYFLRWLWGVFIVIVTMMMTMMSCTWPSGGSSVPCFQLAQVSSLDDSQTLPPISPSPWWQRWWRWPRRWWWWWWWLWLKSLQLLGTQPTLACHLQCTQVALITKYPAPIIYQDLWSRHCNFHNIHKSISLVFCNPANMCVERFGVKTK